MGEHEKNLVFRDSYSNYQSGHGQGWGFDSPPTQNYDTNSNSKPLKS